MASKTNCSEKSSTNEGPLYLCSFCNEESAARRCSGCKTVYYCDVDCQKRDWSRHKPCCMMLQAFLKLKISADSGNEETEKFGSDIETAVKNHLAGNEWENAQQLCVQVIRSQASVKSPTFARAFLLLAKVISSKSNRRDVGLIERTTVILQAAALCNYVLNLGKQDFSSANGNFSEIEKEATAMIVILQDEMFSVIGVDVSKGGEAFEKAKKYRATLTEIRNRLRDDINSLPTVSHDDLDQEFEHYKRIQEIYKHIGEEIRKLCCEMLEDCSHLLGSPPCDFAAIALGSLARLEATPYSDLEWAILIERQDERCKEYFRKLTQLLHLMVINLGETIVPSMAIPCLTWFYDDVTPRGMAFDGALPQACKTPIGKRDGDGKLVYELIGTPKELSQFQNLEWIKVDEKLAGVLRNVLVINKSEKAEKLVQEYRLHVERALDELVAQEGQVETKGEKLREALALIELNRDFYTFNPRLGQDDQACKFYDVKKEIYRLLERLLASVSLYFNADGQSAWDCLLWLYNEKVLVKTGMRNLFVAVSIGAEMRARAYTEEGRQKDYLDCQAFMDATHKGLEKAVCMLGISSIQTLFRYYYTVLPFFSHVYLCFLGVPGKRLQDIEKEDFYCDSPKYSALINMRFRQYNKAKVELQRHLMAYPKDDEAVSDLGNVLKNLQKFSEAALLHRKALHGLLCTGNYVCNGEKLRSLDQITCWRDFVRPFISSMNTTVEFYLLRVHLYNLGLCYGNIQQNEKAIDCLECCVELYRDVVAREGCGTLFDVQGLARSLNLLGASYMYCNDVEKSLACLEESRNLYAVCGSQWTVSAEAIVEYNMGKSYYCRGQLQLALTTLKAALDKLSYAYGKSEGPEVLCTKFLLAKVYLSLQRYGEAVELLTHCIEAAALPFGTPITKSEVEPYLKIALIGVQISQGSNTVTENHFTEIFSDNDEDENVVAVALYLAEFCIRLQQPRWAFNISKKCLTTLRELFDEAPTRSYTFNLRILGRSCSMMGDVEMALDYFTRALRNHYAFCKMRGGLTDSDRGIEVSLLVSLGNIYKKQESYKQALEKYHECLEIQSTIAEDKTIVVTLSNLGMTYCLIGRLDKGLLFLEMAFHVVQRILGEKDEDQTVIDQQFLTQITESLCTTLKLCNQDNKILEVMEESSRLMDILSKKYRT